MATIDLGQVVGAQGLQGERGPAGPQGIQGIQGPRGLQGDKGDKGDKGEKGDTGAAGARGPAGADGAAGPQGERGPGSNPNLLDNWYFADPVNQRGKTSYTGEGYSFDRWYLRSGGTDGPAKATLEDGGIRIVRATCSSISALNQRLENPNGLLGKKATISVLVTENTSTRNSALHVAMSNGSGLNSSEVFRVVIPAGTTGLFSATGTFPEGLGTYSGLNFGIVQYYDINQVNMKISAVKLELGDAQTLAHQDTDGNWVLNDPPPNKALELAKCQRYYQRYDKAGFCGVVYLRNTIARLFIPTPVTMRANPAVAISGHFDTYTAAGESIETDMTYSGSGVLSDNGVTVSPATTGDEFQDAVSLFAPYDDGLIELSADL